MKKEKSKKTSLQKSKKKVTNQKKVNKISKKNIMILVELVILVLMIVVISFILINKEREKKAIEGLSGKIECSYGADWDYIYKTENGQLTEKGKRKVTKEYVLDIKNSYVVGSDLKEIYSYENEKSFNADGDLCKEIPYRSIECSENKEKLTRTSLGKSVYYAFPGENKTNDYKANLKVLEAMGFQCKETLK